MLKTTLRLAAVPLLGIAMMSVAIGTRAQDATPCATTTADENAQIVQQYFDAVNAGDRETADALLADDFQHNLSMPGAVVENLPGNADELANIDLVADVNVVITRIIAQGDWVALSFEFDVSGELAQLIAESEAAATPAAGAFTRLEVMAFVRIECGMIAEGQLTSNLFRVLLSHGWQIVPPGGA